MKQVRSRKQKNELRSIEMDGLCLVAPSVRRPTTRRHGDRRDADATRRSICSISQNDPELEAQRTQRQRREEAADNSSFHIANK